MTIADWQPRPTCLHCRRPARLCVCRFIVPVANRTRIYVLQHPRERSHPFGTVRLLRLALARFDLEVAARDAQLKVGPKPALLYPTPDARALEDLDAISRPDTLVVLDGTWPQARKLYRDNPRLQSLPKVRLDPERPGRYRIRRAPRAHQLSTVEAVAAALDRLDPDCDAERLVDAFERMIDAQIAESTRHASPRHR